MAIIGRHEVPHHFPPVWYRWRGKGRYLAFVISRVNLKVTAENCIALRTTITHIGPPKGEALPQFECTHGSARRKILLQHLNKVRVGGKVRDRAVKTFTLRRQPDG